MTTATTQPEAASERALFESAMSEFYRMDLELDGSYESNRTEAGWLVWQARAALVAPAPAPGPVLSWQDRIDVRPDFQAPKEGWPSSTLAMLGEIADLRAALTAQPVPSDLPYCVAEFWSSANPAKKVLMLAEGSDIEQWAKRSDFIRWVAAQPAPQAPDAPAVPTDSQLVELMKMSESTSMDMLRRGLRMAISALCDIASEPGQAPDVARDAVRYQFMRNHQIVKEPYNMILHVAVRQPAPNGWCVDSVRGIEMDVAIDKAIAQEKAQ